MKKILSVFSAMLALVSIIVTSTASFTVGTASVWIFHQPKAPKSIQK